MRMIFFAALVGVVSSQSCDYEAGAEVADVDACLARVEEVLNDDVT